MSDSKAAGALPQPKARIPLVPAEGPPDEVWADYFSKHKPDPAAVCDVVLRLHQAKKHDHAIAVIEAALVQGQSHPWMYTVLAQLMENVGRPKDEIERVLLSGVDFSAVNIPNLLYSASFLSRFGREDRALQLYRQASEIDPTRSEPYVLGLSLARKVKDADGVQWAASGILMRVWTKDYESLHRDAEQVAIEMEAWLRHEGRAAEADKLAAAIAEARQRDLIVELSWSGKGDLDIVVEEPPGTLCSFETPHTMAGGVLVHDGYGPNQKETYEKYVCARGMAGDYRVRIRHVYGDVVGKRAILKVTRYQGTPHEMEETLVLQIGAEENVVRMTLHRGRLKEFSPVPQNEQALAPRPNPRTNWWQMFAAEMRNAGRGRAEGEASRVRTGNRPPVGYQPVITVIPDGVRNAAMAVISADRRYVRISLSPTFTALTDVFTFSFLGNGGATGQGGGAGAGGAGGAGVGGAGAGVGVGGQR